MRYFPEDHWAGHWRLTQILRWRGDQGQCICARPSDPEDADSPPAELGLATVAPAQRVALADQAAALALRGLPGVTPLREIAPLASPGPAYDVLIEALPEGRPSDEVELSPQEVKRLAMSVIDVVIQAHQRGQILQGIQPSLIYVKARPQGWVFSGIAPRGHVFTWSAGSHNHAAPPLSPVIYVPPEVIRGGDEAWTTAADIFALCVTLTGWMTGQSAFEGEGWLDQTQAVISGARRPWGSRWWSAEQAVAAGLSPDPQARPQAGKLKATLRPAIP